MPRASDLLKLLLSGQPPKERALHHWIVALRSLFNRESPRWGWVSSIDGEQDTVEFVDGEPRTHTATRRHEVDTLELTLQLPPNEKSIAFFGPAEYKQLCDRCALTPIPVTADGRIVSQQPPAVLVQSDFAAVWFEESEVKENVFSYYAKATHSKKTKPFLIASKTLKSEGEIAPCSNILIAGSTNRRKPPGTEVFWLRDGALLGPMRLDQTIRGVKIQIICPGDHLQMNLSEWGTREPQAFFPNDAVVRGLREMSDHLRPRKSKVVDFDYKRDLKWLTRLGELGVIIGDILDGMAKRDDKVGLPEEFVDGLDEFCLHNHLLLSRY